MKLTTRRALARGPADNNGLWWMDDIKPHDATYFTAELLQRTSGPGETASSVWASDHFALERMARGLRQDYIAHLVYSSQLWATNLLGTVLRAAVGGAKATSYAFAPIARWVDGVFDAAAAYAFRWKVARREAYLAQAIDVYDVERRMRDLERRPQRSFS